MAELLLEKASGQNLYVCMHTHRQKHDQSHSISFKWNGLSGPPAFSIMPFFFFLVEEFASATLQGDLGHPVCLSQDTYT